MKEKLKQLTKTSAYVNYGVKEGYIDTEIYVCPCEKGTVQAVFKRAPGINDSEFSINCRACRRKYEIYTGDGARSWDIREKKSKLTKKA